MLQMSIFLISDKNDFSPSVASSSAQNYKKLTNIYVNQCIMLDIYKRQSAVL